MGLRGGGGGNSCPPQAYPGFIVPQHFQTVINSFAVQNKEIA